MKLTKIAYTICLLTLLCFLGFIIFPRNNQPTSVTRPSVPTLAPVIDNRCLITVDGQKYDVTAFRDQHSGGDVFNCGTDMSTAFHQKHSQRYLQMMVPYKI